MPENATRVREVYEAFAKGDISKLLEVLDANVAWHQAEHSTYWSGKPFVGGQAVVEGVLARMANDFESHRIDIARVLDCGDTVLVEARYRGKIRATGLTMDAQVAHVWDFRDGKVVRWQQYTDTWQLAQVMGTQPRAVSS